MISLCTFVKDEAHCIAGMFDSILNNPIKQYINDIVIVDTGSTDNTIEICKRYTNRIYKIPFTNFGEIRTLTAHLAKEPWVLMVDSDERIDGPEKLWALTKGSFDAYALPRRRWLDLQRLVPTEMEAFPDYQVRFFRNNKSFTWKRELHEYFDGCEVKNMDPNSYITPYIDHFHDVFKSPEALQKRSELYTRLAAQAGVTIEGGKKLEGI